MIVNLKSFEEIWHNFKKTTFYAGLQHGGWKQKSVALLIKDLDDVTTSKSINATILKLIKESEHCHGRFTANYLTFLPRTLIQRKM